MISSLERQPTHQDEQSISMVYSNPVQRALCIAYLTTQYPAVSHTFIRREINELERRGHRILRLSIRPPASDLCDPADKKEADLVHVVLNQGSLRILWQTLVTAISRPNAFIKGLGVALSMWQRSDRGFVRHLGYMAEACHLLRVCRQKGVDHIHVHFGTNPAAVARIIKQLDGPGYSMTVHGPDEFDAPRTLSLAEKVVDSRFTNAISSFGRAQLQRWSPVDTWRKIHVVRCTIEASDDHCITDVDEETNTFVCVGRLTPQKGQLIAIEAMARLKFAGIHAQLRLVGDGELRAAVEQAIARYDVDDCVTITGWAASSEVQEHLRTARAMVLPSYAEGLPVVIMEALAMGRPVITTYVAGIPELVRPGGNGWLVPAGDAEQLADAMQQVLTTPAARLSEMGRAGAEQVLRQHHPSVQGEQLDSILQNLHSSG